jgi:hypothetical protein
MGIVCTDPRFLHLSTALRYGQCHAQAQLRPGNEPLMDHITGLDDVVKIFTQLGTELLSFGGPTRSQSLYRLHHRGSCPSILLVLNACKYAPTYSTRQVIEIQT